VATGNGGAERLGMLGQLGKALLSSCRAGGKGRKCGIWKRITGRHDLTSSGNIPIILVKI